MSIKAIAKRARRRGQGPPDSEEEEAIPVILELSRRLRLIPIVR